MSSRNDELTPMMRQYRRIKAGLPPGVLLLFRLGDFYELFFDDAREAAPILGVALTHRAGAPMCGVPYHAIDSYLAKLIRAGRKAAVCDQMEDPAAARGIVRRDVTRVVTPGTATEEALLDASRNNYLAAVHGLAGGGFGMALLDLSTGDFSAEALPDADALRENLRRYAPAECLAAESQRENPQIAPLLAGPGTVTAAPDWTFAYDAARDALVRHFRVHSLEGFGCEGRPALVCPAGALLHYVGETLRHALGHVRALRPRQPDDFVVLDESTCANLDLLPRPGRTAEATLLGVLDVTRTPMGARLLRAWLMRPLRRREAIERRLDAVAELAQRRDLLQALREDLAGVRDIERLISRVATPRGNARDVQALALSLAAVPALRDRTASAAAGLLRETAASLHPLPEVVDLVGRAIAETPPPGLRDGGMIRPGYDAGLDELRQLAHDAHAWLAAYQAREQERTGIRTLKVRHNKVFGFYIEVSKGQAANVPAGYERRQTLVGAERFATPELKEYEQRVVGAQERSVALEAELFEAVRARVAEHTAAIQETAAAVAALDTLAALADRALALDYARPEMHEGDEIVIEAGRHPVIEQLPDAERFVPNDTRLDGDRHQIAIITGPNMAGKSTYIRQVALLAILAHAGSFVPAARARISLIDRVFTRVGAGDDLARGRSTFMVEMQEAANILNNATDRSLIVLDEIGRGTSTFDGISIAWAVAEYLHNTPRQKAKTLFATHYHELTDLALTLPGVQNYTVRVRESGDRVAFLRRIEPGTADKSYGIHVARLAGLPAEVVERAREILANLEEGELEAGMPRLARHGRRREGREHPGQLTLF
jgi:DNA mismatch repair protein MutS